MVEGELVAAQPLPATSVDGCDGGGYLGGAVNGGDLTSSRRCSAQTNIGGATERAPPPSHVRCPGYRTEHRREGGRPRRKSSRGRSSQRSACSRRRASGLRSDVVEHGAGSLALHGSLKSLCGFKDCSEAIPCVAEPVGPLREAQDPPKGAVWKSGSSPMSAGVAPGGFTFPQSRYGTPSYGGAPDGFSMRTAPNPDCVADRVESLSKILLFDPYMVTSTTSASSQSTRGHPG
jgi:hypothetical protein